MSHPTCCCSVSVDRCDRCDLAVGLEGDERGSHPVEGSGFFGLFIIEGVVGV